MRRASEIWAWDARWIRGVAALEPTFDAIAPGGRGVWIAPLPSSGSIRLRLWSGDVAGEWAEIDAAPLREGATRTVSLWAAYQDDGGS